MSVLSFPRLYFSGTMSWDPIVTNNSEDDYDGVTARAGLRPGETLSCFRQRMINSTVIRRDWNSFGSHVCALENTQVTGGSPKPRESADPDDQLLAAPVALIGKLVDIDPGGALSQVFFDELTIGAAGRAHLRARPRRRLSSRWVNFGRNLGLRGPAAASAAWQAVFPAADVEIVRSGESPLLASLEDALCHPRARGLMYRMSVYRTQYFRNGIRNPYPPAANLAELQQLHQRELVPNPAYSVVVGVVGVWFEGDSESVPGGRLLFRSEPDGLLGPAAAEFHPDDGVLSLDFSNTIPERNANLEKLDVGPLIVSVTRGGVVSEIGRIEPTAYNRAAYEATAGIVDIDVSAPLDGTLTLSAGTIGGRSASLAERELSAFCDDCNVYLDQDEVRTLVIHVREHGAVPARPLSVLVATYPASMVAPAETTVLPVSADGTVELEIRGTAPGFRHLGFFTIPADGTGPIEQPPESLGIDSAQLTSVRTLPFDDKLATDTPDGALTWDFVYANILVTYDAIAPRMSTIIDLSDGDAVRTFALRVKEVTSAELFESSRYMPVTRDLSRGKRTLLHRFCDLALGVPSVVGSVPASQTTEVPASPQRTAPPPTPDRLPGVPVGTFFDKRDAK